MKDCLSRNNPNQISNGVGGDNYRNLQETGNNNDTSTVEVCEDADCNLFQALNDATDKKQIMAPIKLHFHFPAPWNLLVQLTARPSVSNLFTPLFFRNFVNNRNFLPLALLSAKSAAAGNTDESNKVYCKM